MNATRHLRPRHALGLAVALATYTISPAALAQTNGASRVALRGGVGGGVMLPEVQRAQLGYESLVLQATGRLAVNVVPWLSLQLSVHDGFYFVSQQGSTRGARWRFRAAFGSNPGSAARATSGSTATRGSSSRATSGAWASTRASGSSFARPTGSA